MRLSLSEEELSLLRSRQIPFSNLKDYDDSAALDLLEMVRDAQVAYSQYSDERGKELYFRYEHLADKIHAAIPE